MRRIFPLFILILSCNKSKPQEEVAKGFNGTPETISIKEGIIPEASGIADSKKNAGYLWVEQDSGNPPMIYLLKHDGTVTDSVMIIGATNRDWEDMALSGDQLYIGEIGDNNKLYSTYKFYRLPEPVLGTHNISEYDVIEFKYPDGSHDAEAFLVDPENNDIYVITKNDTKSRVYKLPYPQSTTTVNDAVFINELEFSGVVSAAIFPDGQDIIVKTYPSLYHYTKNATEPVSVALIKSPIPIQYQVEPQGEAISFGLDNKGFYTLSEKAFNFIPVLNYYTRK